MTPITKPQIKAVRATLYRHGLMYDKENIIDSFTNGRTGSISEMTLDEARELLMAFNSPAENKNTDDKGPMIRKLFAMAHEMGWIRKVQAVDEKGAIIEKNDNTKVYDWVTKYGYKKTELRRYTYKELPKLLSQFEFNIYKPYLKAIGK